MANQRMFLRCRSCGEQFFIGKRMRGGYYTGGFVDSEKLDLFYDRHVYCKGNGEDCYEIAYEFEPIEYDEGK